MSYLSAMSLMGKSKDPSPPTPKPDGGTSKEEEDSAKATAADPTKTKPNEYDVYLIAKPKKKREAPEKGFLSDRLGVSVDVRQTSFSFSVISQ
jgi:hypothetical protein